MNSTEEGKIILANKFLDKRSRKIVVDKAVRGAMEIYPR